MCDSPKIKTATPTKKKPEDDEEETKEPPLCRAVFDGVEIREGAPLPVSQATSIPADKPADDDPDDVRAAKPCDPDDPDGKYPSDWPYYQAEAHKFL